MQQHKKRNKNRQAPPAPLWGGKLFEINFIDPVPACAGMTKGKRGNIKEKLAENKL